MPVPICNRFYAKRANRGQIKFLRKTPTQNFVKKLQSLWQPTVHRFDGDL